MLQRVLHTVFIFLLIAAVPFSPMARPVVVKKAVKKEQSTKQEKESTAFVQPQLVHAQAYHVQLTAPCVLDFIHCEWVFAQEETRAPVGFALTNKGTTKFFKTLFRHFIATQAP